MNYFIIDALNLAYRAHNANYDLKTGAGMYSGMFFGFVRTIFSLKKKYRGYKFEVVWDRKPIHKTELLPDYKAGRASLPDTIFSQVSDIETFLENSGVDQFHCPNQEADDVIATLVERHSKEDGSIIVYSNDKDLLQLVKTGKVIVYKPKVAVSPEKFYDEDAVVEQFGVPPEKLACFRSFDGDVSDNITGVHRVPRKIISSLVNKYGTIHDIYEALPSQALTPFQRESLEECSERVSLNLKVITLNRSLEGIVSRPGNLVSNNLTSLFKKYEIKSLNPDNIIELFSSSLNIKYTDPRETIKVESFSLFD